MQATRPTRRTTGEPYDDFVKNAAKNHIQVLFTIYGTPDWANGGNKPNRAPKQMSEPAPVRLAAAKRYSGTYKLRRRDDAAGRPQVDGVERAEQPGLPAAAVDDPRPAQDRPDRRAHVRADLHRGLGRRPLDAPQERSRRLRRHRPARQQPGAGQPPVDRAADVPGVPQAVRAVAQALRRLRAPSVLQPPEREPDDDAEVEDGRHAREHQRADQAAHARVRAQDALDHGVRLPDAAARPALRGLVGEAGEVPLAGATRSRAGIHASG